MTGTLNTKRTNETAQELVADSIGRPAAECSEALVSPFASRVLGDQAEFTLLGSAGHAETRRKEVTLRRSVERGRL